MERTQRNQYFIKAAIFLVVGMALTFSVTLPLFFIKGILLFFGGSMVVYAIYTLISSNNHHDTLFSLIQIVLYGCLVLMSWLHLLYVVRYLPFLFILLILINGLYDLLWIQAVDPKMKNSTIIQAILAFVCALLLIFQPFFSIYYLLIIVGLYHLFTGAILSYQWYQIV